MSALNDRQPTDHLRTLERIDEYCDRFESAWNSASRLSIEELLEEVGGADRPRVLAELIFLELDLDADSGSFESRRREFVDRFPNERPIVESVFNELVKTRASGTTELNAHDTALHRLELPSLPVEFGDYRLLAEAGRGGMGIVYRAEQRQAGREVALKLIRSDRLAMARPRTRGRMLERFRQEALAAAGIEHDHIVTVYDVGEHEGQPYYSMQFVAGSSLADRLREGPMEGRKAAELLAPIARAMAAAHRHSVVHRDIKPHNVLIDSRTGRAMITDFGLAKLADSSVQATRTGEVFGSPGYISPEQARNAAEVDEASDIYSLGATLYHCLTGRPPFQSDSIGETMRQVAHDDPVAPRLLNPSVELDLETICLKCLEKEPARRYVSTDDLADDLQRFLEHRPIVARPVGQWGKVSRWCRRNRSAASFAGLAAAMLVTLCIGSLVAAIITDGARDRANASLAVEREAKDELVDALLRYVDTVSNDSVMSSASFQPLREELLADASARLMAFADADHATDDDRLRAAQILHVMAQVHHNSGRSAEAVELAKRCSSIVSQLNNEAAIHLYQDSHLMLARFYLDSGFPNMADKAAKQAIERNFADPNSVYIICLARAIVGEAQILRGNRSEGVRSLSESYNGLSRLSKPWATYQVEEMLNISLIATETLAEDGRVEDSRQWLDRTAKLVDGLSPSDLGQLSLRLLKLRHRLNSLKLAWGLGTPLDQLAEGKQLVSELKQLHRDNPLDSSLRLLTADACIYSGSLSYCSGDADSARSDFEFAESLLIEVRDSSFERLGDLTMFVQLGVDLATIHQNEGAFERAIAQLEQVRTIALQRINMGATSIELEFTVASIEAILALMYDELGDSKRASQLFLKAVRKTEELASTDDASARFFVWHAFLKYYSLQIESGTRREFLSRVAAVEELIRQAPKAQTDIPLVAAIQSSLAIAKVNNARITKDSSHLDIMAREIVVMREIAADSRLVGLEQLYLRRLFDVANFFRVGRRYAESLELFKECLSIARRFAKLFPFHLDVRQRYALSALAVANLLRELEGPIASREYYKEAVSAHLAWIDVEGGVSHVPPELVGSALTSYYFVARDQIDVGESVNALKTLDSAIPIWHEFVDANGRENSAKMIAAYLLRLRAFVAFELNRYDTVRSDLVELRILEGGEIGDLESLHLALATILRNDKLRQLQRQKLQIAEAAQKVELLEAEDLLDALIESKELSAFPQVDLSESESLRSNPRLHDLVKQVVPGALSSD